MDEFSLFYEDIPWNGKELFQPTKRLPKLPERGAFKKKINQGFCALVEFSSHLAL